MAAAGGLALTCLAGGIGALLFRGESLHPLTRLALQAGLGFGLLGLGVLAVGVTVGLPAWLPWAALGFLGVLLYRSIWGWLHGWRGLARLWRESGRFERILAVLVAVIFLMTLGVALAPPVQFDSLVYHLVMPDAYLREGRVSYLPWIVMSGMPQTAEMLYTWMIALAGNPAAVVLGWRFGLLAVVGLVGACARPWMRGRPGWARRPCWRVSPRPGCCRAVTSIGWSFYRRWVRWSCWRPGGKTARGAAWFWAGCLRGLAVGSKYTSGVLALAGLWRPGLACLEAAGRLIPAACLTLRAGWPCWRRCPGCSRMCLTTGNPFYPFFLHRRGNDRRPPAVYQHLPAWGSWLDFVFLPLRATYLGFDAGDGYMFAPGMLLLGLGGLAWLARDGARPAARAPTGGQPDPSRPAEQRRAPGGRRAAAVGAGQPVQRQPDPDPLLFFGFSGLCRAGGGGRCRAAPAAPGTGCAWAAWQRR